MPANLINLEENLHEKIANISNTTTSMELLELFKSVQLLKNGAVINVANTSDLPTGTDIKTGVFYYDESGADVYYYSPTTSKWFKLTGVNQPIYMWGRNNYGQLGYSGNRLIPAITADRGLQWNLVTVGKYHTSAIRLDNTLWTWGYNLYGNLGTGDTTSRSSPGTVAGGGTTWSQVSSGGYHTAAVKTDGTLWTWGYNAYGNLGDGTTSSRTSPGTVAGGGTTWKQVTASFSSYSTAAVKTDGTLWTWGYNPYGNLGDGSTTSRSSPGTLSGGGTTWSAVATGDFHSIATKTDGTIWAWGLNSSGQLGDGTTTSRTSPVQEVNGVTTWSSISAGPGTSAAIRTDGTLWTWGNGTSGKLGNGTATNRSIPGTVAGGGTNWSQVSMGYYAAAIKTDGTLWTWGSNGYYQLGTGDTTSRSSPGTTVSTVGAWIRVAAGVDHTAAIGSL